jgi:hypothetical protein
MNTYTTKSKRLKKFLYGLGFEFKLINKDEKECYQFVGTEMLKESIEFYYKVRESFQNK